MIPVQERQNLILAVGVQTRGRAHWNIQATMISCGHVSLAWRGKLCWGSSQSALTSYLGSDTVRTCQVEGEEEEREGDTRHSINVVGEEGEGGLREYNTSSGAMILVSRKNKQYYTWVSQRQPRKVKGKVNAKTNTRTSQREKRKRNKKQREKKKKGANTESPRASPIHPVTDPSLPVVKIMFANQVICSGVIIHPLYVLTSAHCVANMTGLYILQEDNMVSLYQVYIYNQHDSHALAVIQTLTNLPSRKVCFQGLGKYFLLLCL